MAQKFVGGSGNVSRSELMVQLRAFVDWEERENPGQKHIAGWAISEIERLSAALERANAQTERFERGWYLRGMALEKLEQWAAAYPVAVFPKPDLKRANEVLQANGMTLDSISADTMRHVLHHTKVIVAEGLAS